jgi:fibronectin type 3 domain-containing protein
VAAKKQYASDPIGNLSVPVEVYIGEFISNTTDRAPLPAPSNITATVDLSYSSPRVTLIWTMVTDATYYEIYRGTDAEFSDYICLAANHGGTSIYTDTTGLQAGTIYYYKIGAKRYSNDPVELSAPIAARIGVSSITGLNATSLSESSIKLSWSPSPAHGIMGYKVYRALNTSSNFETIATVNTPTIEYIDTLLLAYTRYYYKISPVDSNENEGPLSSSTYATTQASTIAPNNITASSNGQIITLSWEEIQGASIYNIYIGFSAEGPYALVNSLSSIGTVYHVSSLNGTVLTANTTYFFKIGTGGDMSTVTAFATTGP